MPPQPRRLRKAPQSAESAKLDAVLDAQKQTNELLTLLVRACVKTVNVPAGESPPPGAVRVDQPQIDPFIS